MAHAAIGDKATAADHVCLLGYRVGSSEVDLLGDLDRIIDLDAEAVRDSHGRRAARFL